jgi:hypothetical protein
MRIVVAAIVGGLIVFIWSAIAHLATPLGTMGFSTLSGERHVLEVMRGAAPKSGMYIFPAEGLGTKMTAEQQKAWEQKLRTGPSGILVITTGGGEAMSPRQLISELVSNIVAALIAAFLVSMMAGSYFKRAFAVALFGLFGVVSLLVSYWIWYGFPPLFVTGELITEVVGWFLAGLAIAKIVRFPATARAAL